MARAKTIRTFTKGAWVRYGGNDPRKAEIWGERIYKVSHKCGDSVVGMFPIIGTDGKMQLCEYSTKINDLCIVY